MIAARNIVLLFVLVALAACTGGKTAAPLPDAVVAYADISQVVEVGGRLVPRDEIFVRPLVSGILADVRVRAGQRVKRGHHLATVRIVADPVTLAEARAAERRAVATLTSAQRELTRVRGAEGVAGISAREIAHAEDAELLARAELETAEERALLIARGVAGALRSGESGARSTHVLAPVDGTVLAIPVAVGDFVTDSNSYRDGTAVAVIADIEALVFKGFVEEVHVGQLELGMAATVRVGALAGDGLPGKLSWIAPRADIEPPAGGSVPTLPNGQPVLAPLTGSTSGNTRFELWIDVLAKQPERMRAGYTASAELLLAKHTHTLSVAESALRFEAGKALAELRTALGSETRTVTLGISDGVRVEVLAGLKEGERLIAPSK